MKIFKLFVFVVACIVIGGILSCGGKNAKERKCREAEEKIVMFAVELEDKLNATVSESERMERKEIKEEIFKKVDGDGKFVRQCMEEFSDAQLDCILKLKKFSEYRKCFGND